MCLLLIAVNVVADAPLLLLGNRDEFHERPSAAAQPWSEDERIVGGRDLVAGGSWLAVRSDGRFAAVTNLRTGVPATAPRSRGWLVRDFVLGDEPATEFLEHVREDIGVYGPFNLVLGDADGAFVLGSANAHAQRLPRGIHVMSNGPIGVHWPKTERLQRQVATAIAGDVALDAGQLLDFLADEWRPEDDALPHTGVGLDLERVLSPIFIHGETYGTRAGTLVVRNSGGAIELIERRFGPGGVAAGQSAWQSAAGSLFAAATGS
ncbi:MAG: NRDE family protein [Rhodanobacteraceae bacterium]